MQGLGTAQSVNTLNTLAGRQNGLAGAQQILSDHTHPQSEVEPVFQAFVAGTCYCEMLKSLHAMHDKPAYLHGGQAEELFQSQLDQVIAGQMAKEHGAALVGPLFEAFQREVKGTVPADTVSAAYDTQPVNQSGNALDTAA